MFYQTTILVALALAALLMVVPRKYFLVPFILATCFVPAEQRIIIADLDFTVVRILVLVGIMRIMLRGERRSVQWNFFDKMVLAWAICGSVIFVILWANIRAVIYKCGALYDIIGLYWIFRQRIRSWDDILFTIKILSICVLSMAPFVALEWLTGKNPFAVLGMVETGIRMGRFRCQGAFNHAILFGLFWATLTPLFIGMARTKANKKLFYSAAVASIFSVIASASSTPVMGLFAGLVALCAFRWRHFTRQIVITLLLMTICLHMIMTAPVWHLIARVNIFGGSTGWHRYNLIQQAINHFGEWALLGCRSTAHWGWLQEDITNQYIIEGVRGGVVTLGLFIALQIISFKTLIQLSQQTSNRDHQLLAWCFSATLFAHCVSFLGVAYFGQIMLLWYLLLAIVGFLFGEREKQKNRLSYTLRQRLSGKSEVKHGL